MLYYRNKIVMKSCFADSTCNAFSEYKFPMHFPELSIGFPRLHVVGTCVYTTELPSGSRKWGHLPTIGISKAIYHYMTNTTKQQPTYKVFQNIMRPKKRLVSPPKTTKFTSMQHYVTMTVFMQMMKTVFMMMHLFTMTMTMLMQSCLCLKLITVFMQLFVMMIVLMQL